MVIALYRSLLFLFFFCINSSGVVHKLFDIIILLFMVDGSWLALPLWKEAPLALRHHFSVILPL